MSQLRMKPHALYFTVDVDTKGRFWEAVTARQQENLLGHSNDVFIAVIPCHRIV